MAVTAESTRQPHLDGLRGVAACLVFFGHLSVALSPHRFALGNDSSVCIFFVLSGYVLSELARHSPLSFPAQTVRRYIRLVVPMLITSVFAWALLAAGLYRNREAGALVDSWWLGNWYNFSPSFPGMVTETLYGVFVTGRSDYNCNLWTMRPELIGSLLVFLIHATAASRRLRSLCFVALAVLYANDYVALFAVGALLHDFHAELSRYLTKTPLLATLFAVAIFLCIGGIKWVPLPQLFSNFIQPMLWHMIGASLLVTVVLYWGLLKLVLGNALGRLLGRVSFVLYLIHVPIICSFTSWMLLAMPPGPAVPVAAGATIVLVFVVSIGIYRIADELPTRWSRAAGYAIDGLASVPAGEQRVLSR